MRINSEKTSNEIFRKLRYERKKQGNPVGWVQLFEKNKLMYENHNLVVATGREYIAQKATSIVEIPSGGIDLRDYDLTHYAFGAGGATTDGLSYTLLGPDVCDQNLELPVSFDIDGFLNEPGEETGEEDIYSYVKAVKPIVYPSGNNSYEYLIKDYPDEDPTCSHYTQINLTLYKEAGEFDLLDTGAAVPISEAGLYLTSGTDALLFARICFPPKFMELEAQYGIEWYILA
jgi:hypothetical protein